MYVNNIKEFCMSCQLKKLFPYQKETIEKHDFKGKKFYVSITESHLLQKALNTPLQIEIRIKW